MYRCANCGEPIVLIPYVGPPPRSTKELWLHDNGNRYGCKDLIVTVPPPARTPWDAAMEAALTGVVCVLFVSVVLYCLMRGWGWI
jgi:hypothetical protein